MQNPANTPMKLVLITNSRSAKFETDIVNRLFREGLNELHLRKPDYEKKDFIKFLDNIDDDFHSRIVLHDCYSLVHQYDIQKIHISRERRNSFAFNFILNNITLRSKKVAKSTSISDCQFLYKPVTGLDEIIIGPVFKKSMYMLNSQMIKTDDLTRAIRHSKFPILGLGGVTTETIDFYKKVGFSGVVLQTSVWKSPDPVRAFILLRDQAHASEQPLRIAI